MSKHGLLAVSILLLANALNVVSAAETPSAIQSVEIGPHRELRVNGKPMLPIMAWLQDAENFPAVR
ncbi:MAG: hypothetical protein ACOC8H_01935, partial [bacterium]